MAKSIKNRFLYNPEVDLKDVEQFGFVSLNEVIETGIVPSSLPDSEPDFNGVLNPSMLMHRAQDVFEATRAAQYVKDTLALMSDAEKKQLAGSQVNVDFPSVADPGTPSE